MFLHKSTNQLYLCFIQFCAVIIKCWKRKNQPRAFFFKANEEEVFPHVQDITWFFCKRIFSKSGMWRYVRINSIEFCRFFLLIDLMSFLTISFQNIYSFRNEFLRSIICILTLGMGFQGGIIKFLKPFFYNLLYWWFCNA